MTDERKPKHLAIILDGNGRWAKKRNLPRLMGHRAGLRKLEDMVRLVKREGIRYFSVYAFSTENWNRPIMEVTGLMSLFRYYIRRKVDEIKSEGARIRFCGRKDRLPEDLLAQMKWAEDYTADQKILDFIICFRTHRPRYGRRLTQKFLLARRSRPRFNHQDERRIETKQLLAVGERVQRILFHEYTLA